MKKEVINLAGQWRYLVDPENIGEKRKYFYPKFGFSTWEFMNIPSNWQVAGLNDYCGVVWFKTSFQISNFQPALPAGRPNPNHRPGRDPATRDKEYYIKFNGVDYFAKVWLNGELLGEHEGYFQPFEFNITKHIKHNEENILVVKVNSPREDTQKVWPHRKKIIKGIFGHHDIRPGSWSPEFGQSMGTGGIWGKVELVICDKIKINQIKVTPVLSKNLKKANLIIDLRIENRGKPASADLEFNVHPIDRKLDNTYFKYRAKLKSGLNKVRVQKNIVEPMLWWSWDHGRPNLYELNVSGTAVRFGIREIKIDENKAWWLNGRKIFIRGTNIIPEEYLSIYSKERIAKDVRLLREANINGVRIHAHVNRKELYEALDEAGILVWQDFALQWEYDQSETFEKNAVSQIKDMVKMLYNNPCVAVWNCHNEPIQSKKKLDKALQKAIASEDSSRPIFEISDFCEHPYPGWFWGNYRYFFAMLGGPMPSEFGAQALPNLETMRRIFKEQDIWPPNWSKWAYHDFTYEQMLHIAKVKIGNSIEEFISNSQQYQSKVLKFAVETFRRCKFKSAAGLFQFMFLEPWPCISYSVVDYFRTPKKGYYTLKAAYQPVLFSAVLQRDIFGIGKKIEGNFWMINDYEEEYKGAKIKILLTKNNSPIHEYPAVTCDIQKNSCADLTNKVYLVTKDFLIPADVEEGDFKLVFKVFDGKERFLSENFEEIKIVKIPAPLEAFNAKFNW